MALCLGTACSDPVNTYEDPEGEISGSGILVSEQRTMGDFNSIVSTGPVTTVVRQGHSREVLVTADDNLLHRVETSVKGHTLHISLEDGQYHSIWIRVEVVVPALSSLTNSGTGPMKVSGIRTTEALRVTNSGSASMFLQGQATQFILRNEGSGSIHGFDLSCDQCTIRNIGDGQVEIYCNGLMEGKNSGSGSVRYRGTPSVQIENTGSGGVFDAN